MNLDDVLIQCNRHREKPSVQEYTPFGPFAWYLPKTNQTINAGGVWANVYNVMHSLDFSEQNDKYKSYGEGFTNRRGMQKTKSKPDWPFGPLARIKHSVRASFTGKKGTDKRTMCSNCTGSSMWEGAQFYCPIEDQYPHIDTFPLDFWTCFHPSHWEFPTGIPASAYNDLLRKLVQRLPTERAFPDLYVMLRQLPKTFGLGKAFSENLKALTTPKALEMLKGASNSYLTKKYGIDVPLHTLDAALKNVQNAYWQITSAIDQGEEVCTITAGVQVPLTVTHNEKSMLQMAECVPYGKTGPCPLGGRYIHKHVELYRLQADLLVRWKPPAYAYDLERKVAKVLNALRISPTASGNWELVPYSFVVDWFIPIGSLIELGEAFSGVGLGCDLDLIDMCVTETSRFQCTMDRYRPLVTSWNREEVLEYKLRKVGGLTDLLNLASVELPNFQRALTGIALATQRLVR